MCESGRSLARWCNQLGHPISISNSNWDSLSLNPSCAKKKKKKTYLMQIDVRVPLLLMHIELMSVIVISIHSFDIQITQHIIN